MKYDDNIPMPPSVPPQESPHSKIKIGQSFFSKHRPNLSHISVKTGFKFATRRVSEDEEGYRTWRTA